jgi:hypothetical protein
LRVNSAKKSLLRKKVFIFFKLCVEAIPVKQTVREKLCANFELKSANLPTAVITYGWIFFALCLVFTFFI